MDYVVSQNTRIDNRFNGHLVKNVNITKFIKKTVTGDAVAHLKSQKNSPFRQICNLLHQHYSASSILLST